MPHQGAYQSPRHRREKWKYRFHVSACDWVSDVTGHSPATPVRLACDCRGWTAITFDFFPSLHCNFHPISKAQATASMIYSCQCLPNSMSSTGRPSDGPLVFTNERADAFMPDGVNRLIKRSGECAGFRSFRYTTTCYNTPAASAGECGARYAPNPGLAPRTASRLVRASEAAVSALLLSTARIEGWTGRAPRLSRTPRASGRELPTVTATKTKTFTASRRHHCRFPLRPDNGEAYVAARFCFFRVSYITASKGTTQTSVSKRCLQFEQCQT